MDVHDSSLLSPLRAPNELAEERSAISVKYCDVMSSIQKQDSPAELNGSSLQPLCQSGKDHQTVDAHYSPETIFIDQCLNDLKNLGSFDILRKIAEIPDFASKS